VDGVLEETGLAPRRDQSVETLSGGWRQRVSVATALVHDPEVLVMDEPTTGLDVRVQDELWGVIRSTAERGAAVLLSTHEIEQVEARADRVGILHEGRLVAEDSPARLRDGLGLSAIAEVEAEDGEAVVAWARARGAAAVPAGERWTLMLREPIALAELAAELADARPRSLALRPVGLVDVFRQVTAPEPRAPSGPFVLPGVA
jgi:ABC-2 type transport system ATP-binding protein